MYTALLCYSNGLIGCVLQIEIWIIRVKTLVEQPFCKRSLTISCLQCRSLRKGSYPGLTVKRPRFTRPQSELFKRLSHKHLHITHRTQRQNVTVCHSSTKRGAIFFDSSDKDVFLLHILGEFVSRKISVEHVLGHG